LVAGKSFADEVVTQLALDYVERKPANNMVIFSQKNILKCCMASFIRQSGLPVILGHLAHYGAWLHPR
jgi:hypothetical protein